MSNKKIILILGIVLVSVAVIIPFSRNRVFNNIEQGQPHGKAITQQDANSALEEALFVEQSPSSTMAENSGFSSEQAQKVKTLLRQSRDFKYLEGSGNPHALAIAFSQANSEELRREVRTGLWDTIGDLQAGLASPTDSIIQDTNRIEFLVYAAAFCGDEKAAPVLEELRNTIRLTPVTQGSELPVFSDTFKLQSDISYAFAKISKNSKEVMKKVFLEFESGDSVVRERIMDGLAGNAGKGAMMLIEKGLAATEEGVRDAARRTLEINNNVTNS